MKGGAFLEIAPIRVEIRLFCCTSVGSHVNLGVTKCNSGRRGNPHLNSLFSLHRHLTLSVPVVLLKHHDFCNRDEKV